VFRVSAKKYISRFSSCLSCQVHHLREALLSKERKRSNTPGRRNAASELLHLSRTSFWTSISTPSTCSRKAPRYMSKVQCHNNISCNNMGCNNSHSRWRCKCRRKCRRPRPLDIQAMGRIIARLPRTSQFSFHLTVTSMTQCSTTKNQNPRWRQSNTFYISCRPSF